MRKLLLILILPALVWASNFGSSMKGDRATVTFEAGAACDSVRLRLGFPDTSNYYINTLMVRLSADSAAWYYTDATGFDSIGGHIASILYYQAGVEYSWPGIWHNLPDTSSMQGAASGLTAAQIADTLAGRGWGRGLGDLAETLFVFDSDDTTIVPGADVWVRPDGGGTPYAHWQTNASGYIVAMLDSGAVDVSVLIFGYLADAVTDITVTAAGRDSVFIDNLEPDTAPAGKVAIQVCLTNAEGDTMALDYLDYRPVSSTGAAYTRDDMLTVGSGIGTTAIVIDFQRVTTNSTCLSTNIFPNTVLTDTLSKYEFIAGYKTAGQEKRQIRRVVAVPDTTQFNPFD